MGDLSNVTFQPQNPDALFSPDQWSNQFSLFNSAALPWPSSYTGYPMDATGNPITPQAGSGIPDYAQWQAGQAAPAPPSATPGTTINSLPASALDDLRAQVNQGTINSANANLDSSIAAGTAPGYSGRGAETGIANYPGATDALIGLAKYQNQANQDYAAGKAIGMPQQASAPASVGGGASNNLTYPQVLSLLASPGKVTTPGASVPAGPSTQPGAGVNNAFLGQAGGGMNQNFLSALAALQGAPQGGGGATPGATGGGMGGLGGMPPPSQGVPGTAFKQPLQQGGTPSWLLGSGGNMGNSLAGFGNTPAGSNPFANMLDFGAAQKKLRG